MEELEETANVREFVEDNELENLGEFDSDDRFVIECEDSDTFSSIYTTISGLFDESESSELSGEKSSSTFTDGNIEATFEADYDNDEYTITITRR